MNSAFDQELVKLRALYQRNLLRYVEQLEDAWQALLISRDRAHIEEMTGLAHRLAGSGKAYGFEALSKVAKDLECACESVVLIDADLIRTQLGEPVISLMSCLRENAKESEQQPDEAPDKAGAAQIDPTRIRLLVVDDDTDFCSHLCGFLRASGYQVFSIGRVDDFEQAIALHEPHAAIVDMDFFGKRFAGATTVFTWRERNGAPIPVIFISAFDSFELRLAAVRSGGNFFLNKPLDHQRLLALLNEQLNLRPDEPYRVLIVDDDEDLLRLYESTLVEAGYAVDTTSRATQALALLERKLPDLVLIDVYMPECDGIELGQLIRQHEKFSHIPLLFMSAAADTDIKLACARLTNDEFINKPIEPWRLVMVVKARSSRIRDHYTTSALPATVASERSQDALTALPALKPFRQAVQARLNTAGPGHPVAILKIDIKDFHTVNNLYGHFVGDQVLQRLAWELSLCLSGDDLLCRESSDEFLVLTSRASGRDDLLVFADTLMKATERPMESGGQHVMALSADIGIAVGQDDISDADELLRCADTALFDAKKSADAAVSVFDRDMRQGEKSRFDLAQEIRQALQDEQFVAAYQPIFSVADGALLGFEALARWLHPVKGQIGPVDFMPVMEEQGLVSSLTNHMLKLALMQLAEWRKGCPGLFMSVNLSARDIQKPLFIDHLRGLLTAYDLAPESVVLEITETVLLADWQHASTTLLQLKALGIKLALDDFGTGYSSLSYLNRIHASKLKIDRSFIHSWSESRDARLLLTMVQLGHGMDMNVVAEGVETPEELELLRELGCDSFQGYLSARPMFGHEVSAAGWFQESKYLRSGLAG